LWAFSLVSLLSSITKAQAQQLPANISSTAVDAELKKRGITEQEVRDRLQLKGINVDNVQPQDLPRIRKQLEDVVKELEDEKAAEKAEKLRQASLEAGEKAGTPATSGSGSGNGNNNGNDKTPVKIQKEKVGEISKDISQGSTTEEALSKILNDSVKDTISAIPAAIFGQQIFRGNRLPYIVEKNYKAPDSYVLNTGDQVNISISGVSYYNQTHTIDVNGAIAPDQLPRVYVRGMSLAKARGILSSSFSRFYRFNKDEFVVSINATRTIAVNIVGEVFNPGTFTLSAGNSAFNALVTAGGPTNIGSVRNIMLIRSNGEKKKLDVYDFLLNPDVAKDFYLYENDYISVPVAERMVEIKGNVRRPFRYELLKNENLMKLLTLSGGLNENSILSSLQVKRFIDDKEKIIDVPYKALKESGRDFELVSGDVVVIKIIPTAYENFAIVEGEVTLPGQYEITPGMRIADLIDKATLKKESKTDIAYILRYNTDKSSQLKLISIDEILANRSSEANFTLSPQDKLLVFPQEKFTDKYYVAIGGAVRDPLRFPYDQRKTMRVTDIVNLAGGLTPDATAYAYVMRRELKSNKLIQYKRIDIQEAMKNQNSTENISLQASDSIYIQSKLTFIEDAYVRVAGAVRQPGEFRWSTTLQVRDLLTMAGGLKLGAATNRIEIFRIKIQNNEPVRTVVATLSVDESLNVSGSEEFTLQPFDQVIVRIVPDFGFQKIVTLTGEVRYPGAYALLDKNERLASVIERAGGFSSEAFKDGATLFRTQDDIGYVILKMDEALKKPASDQNLILKEGDIIEIPKSKDIVSIEGAMKARELYPDKILSTGRINVTYEGPRSAWYYVDNHAAGVAKEGRRRLISVTHPNGEIKRTKNFLFFHLYPKVRKGSVVSVGAVLKKEDTKRRERKEVDWNRVLADTLAQATAVLSFILLIRNLR
jgi:protein involved in polysaccharide export with SLBB domain